MTQQQKRTMDYVVTEDMPMMGDDGEDDEHNMTIRFKWVGDGCQTIDDIIRRLQCLTEWYMQLKQEGWELRETIDDDWGFLYKKSVETIEQDSPKRARNC